MRLSRYEERKTGNDNDLADLLLRHNLFPRHPHGETILLIFRSTQQKLDCHIQTVWLVESMKFYLYHVPKSSSELLLLDREGVVICGGSTLWLMVKIPLVAAISCSWWWDDVGTTLSIFTGLYLYVFLRAWSWVYQSCSTWWSGCGDNLFGDFASSRFVRLVCFNHHCVLYCCSLTTRVWEARP